MASNIPGAQLWPSGEIDVTERFNSMFDKQDDASDDYCFPPVMQQYANLVVDKFRGKFSVSECVGLAFSAEAMELNLPSNRQPAGSNENEIRALGDAIGLWQTSPEDLEPWKFMRNPAYFMEVAGIGSPVVKSNNDRNTSPYIYVRTEYIYFWNKMGYYLDTRQATGPLANKHFVDPLKVGGLTNCGKSSLMWATVEVLPLLYEDVKAGGIVILIFSDIQGTKNTNRTLESIFFICEPATDACRIFKIDNMPDSDVKQSFQTYVQGIKLFGEGSASRDNWVLIADGFKMRDYRSQSNLKSLIFASTQAEPSDTWFDFVLSPSNEKEVVAIWALLCHRINMKRMTPEYRARFEKVDPEDVEKRLYRQGGSIGRIFASDPKDTLWCPTQHVDKIKEKISTWPDSLNRVLANPSMGFPKEICKDDNIMPVYNIKDSWYCVVATETSRDEARQKREDFIDQRVQEKLRSLPVNMKKEEKDKIGMDHRQLLHSLVYLQKNNSGKWEVHWSRPENLEMLWKSKSGKAEDDQSAFKSYDLLSQQRRFVVSSWVKELMAYEFQRRKKMEKRKRGSCGDGNKFESEIMELLQGKCHFQGQGETTPGTWRRVNIFCHRYTLLPSDRDLWDLERVIRVPIAQMEWKASCLLYRQHLIHRETGENLSGIPLNIVVHCMKTEASVDGWVLHQHESPQYVYDGTQVKSDTDSFPNTRGKPMVKGCEMVWFQITLQTDTAHTMYATHLMRQIHAMEAWRRKILLNGTELQKACLPVQSFYDMQHHVVYVYDEVKDVKEPSFHWTEKKGAGIPAAVFERERDTLLNQLNQKSDFEVVSRLNVLVKTNMKEAKWSNLSRAEHFVCDNVKFWKTVQSTSTFDLEPKYDPRVDSDAQFLHRSNAEAHNAIQLWVQKGKPLWDAYAEQRSKKLHTFFKRDDQLPYQYVTDTRRPIYQSRLEGISEKATKSDDIETVKQNMKTQTEEWLKAATSQDEKEPADRSPTASGTASGSGTVQVKTEVTHQKEPASPTASGTVQVKTEDNAEGNTYWYQQPKRPSSPAGGKNSFVTGGVVAGQNSLGLKEDAVLDQAEQVMPQDWRRDYENCRVKDEYLLSVFTTQQTSFLWTPESVHLDRKRRDVNGREFYQKSINRRWEPCSSQTMLDIEQFGRGIPPPDYSVQMKGAPDLDDLATYQELKPILQHPQRFLLPLENAVINKLEALQQKRAQTAQMSGIYGKCTDWGKGARLTEPPEKKQKVNEQLNREEEEREKVLKMLAEGGTAV